MPGKLSHHLDTSCLLVNQEGDTDEVDNGSQRQEGHGKVVAFRSHLVGVDAVKEWCAGVESFAADNVQYVLVPYDKRVDTGANNILRRIGRTRNRTVRHNVKIATRQELCGVLGDCDAVGIEFTQPYLSPIAAVTGEFKDYTRFLYGGVGAGELADVGQGNEAGGLRGNVHLSRVNELWDAHETEPQGEDDQVHDKQPPQEDEVRDHGRPKMALHLFDVALPQPIGAENSQLALYLRPFLERRHGCMAGRNNIMHGSVWHA